MVCIQSDYIQETLEFKDAINFYYLKQIIILQNIVLTF